MIKKLIIVITCLCISVIVIVLYFRMKQRNKFEKEKPYYTVRNLKTDSTTSIAFIGDSWAERAEYNRFNIRLDSILLMNGIRSNCYSKGYGGATSRDIYKLLFSDEVYGLKEVIERCPQYALLSCGINDQHGQYGPEFYAHHTILIAKLLLHYHIRPIILELPKWYIKENYGYYGRRKKIAYRMLCFATTYQWNPEKTTELYRNALNEEIMRHDLKDKIIVINSSFLDNNRLWLNSMHINEWGYDLLAQKVAEALTHTKK